MQDSLIRNPMVDAIERTTGRKQTEQYDPNGLDQYAVWDEAFAGPTLRQRIGGLLARFRRGEKVRAGKVEIVGTTDCLQRRQVGHG